MEVVYKRDMGRAYTSTPAFYLDVLKKKYGLQWVGRVKMLPTPDVWNVDFRYRTFYFSDTYSTKNWTMGKIRLKSVQRPEGMDFVWTGLVRHSSTPTSERPYACTIWRDTCSNTTRARRPPPPRRRSTTSRSLWRATTGPWVTTGSWVTMRPWVTTGPWVTMGPQATTGP